jgi:cytochrome c oxidase cbb3-type subunit III
MLNSFWNWFVIILTVGSILGCWWLLHWTKGISNRDQDKVGSTGHVWDESLVELNAPLPRWWLHLFNITIVFALVYLVLYPGLGNIPGLFGWTEVGSYDAEVSRVRATQEAVYARYRDADPGGLMADAEAMAIGSRLFANNCAMCHGSDGRGAAGFPNLADADWLYGSAYDQVLASISQGRMGVMPPWGAALGEGGVSDMTQYVLSISGQAADPAQAAAGKAQFGLFCAACHGPEGKGNQALGAPNLTDEIWLYGGTPEVIAQTLKEGRNGNMPSHKDLLDEDRQRLLAAYVLTLSAPQAQ